MNSIGCGTPEVFAFWLANYQDMFFAQEANDLCADYIKRKIRKTVKDPVIAEKLIPKGYAYGTKRQPLDTNYYETFNKDNVLLVDAKTDGGIEEITERGIRAGGKEYPLDIIVFATVAKTMMSRGSPCPRADAFSVISSIPPSVFASTSSTLSLLNVS